MGISEENKNDIYDAICNAQEMLGKYEIGFEKMSDKEIIRMYRNEIFNCFDDLDSAVARAEMDIEEAEENGE